MGSGSSSINGMEIVALDCEMIEGIEIKNMLARVSIVDYHGKVIFDSYVHSPQNEIKDYRTIHSGIQPHHLIGAPTFSSVQKRVNKILSLKIVVGHSLQFDYSALRLRHPLDQFSRDIGKSRFIINRYGITSAPRQPVSLRTLTYEIFKRRIQVQQHDSIEDARAIMNIYKHHQEDIENDERANLKLPSVKQRSMGAKTKVLIAGLTVVAIIYFTGIV